MSQFENNIAFVGAGNMAGSIVRGLVHDGYPSKLINVSAPSQNNTASLKNDLAIRCTTVNREIIVDADIVILGVKPQILRSVCEEIGPFLPRKAFIISLAAGVKCSNIERWLDRECAVVRCMSNTPAQIMTGASGLFANSKTNDQQRQAAEKIIGAVGVTCWVESEDLIDTVTAVAGSGPAYFFLFLEAMIDAAQTQGMDKKTANTLAIQTALGAAKLAQNSTLDLAQLRKNVTSPNGTTERAIRSFESEGLRNTVANAMLACVERAQELAKQD